MKEIKLSGASNYVAIIDDEDYALVTQYTWFPDIRDSGVVYAKRNVGSSTQYMHKLIKPELKFVDHINTNGLDNQKCNLRESTYASNAWNRRKVSGTSKFKGVSKFNRSYGWTGKWLACIRIDYETIYLGLYTTEEQAAVAYDLAAIMLFGDFARLNCL